MVYTSSLKLGLVKDSDKLHKRKKWNKNKKKAHRKRIDISDVEKGLDDSRREERHGGPIEERDSSDLLYLDVGDEDLPLGSDPISDGPKELTGFKPMRKKINDATLNCHRFLDGFPGAKDPLKKRNRVRTIEERRDPIVQRKLDREEKGPKGKRKRQQIRDNLREVKNRKFQSKSMFQKDHGFDLWEATNDSDDEVVSTYTREPKQFYKRQTKQAPIKRKPRSTAAPSKLPAVMIPDAGASYNPSFADHQKLLQKAISLEKNKIAKEEREAAKIKASIPHPDQLATTESWLVEMSEGLNNSKEPTEEKEEEQEIADVTVSSRITTERKTRQKRRKEERHKNLIKRKKREKLINMRESEVYATKKINRELNTLELLRKIRRANINRRKAMKPYKTHVLCNTKFEEDDIAVPLGDELTGSLRTIKPHGSVLEEHFQSFQRRNIIETRKRAKESRKTKIKIALKRSHRTPFEEIRKESV